MKKIRLTEDDLVRIVQKVIKENELAEDYGAELSDEIKNMAMELKDKTLLVFSDKFGGKYKIVEPKPSNNKDMLNLGLTLQRLTDFSGNDVKDTAAYHLYGTCQLQNDGKQVTGTKFVFKPDIEKVDRGQLVSGNARISSKLTDMLSEKWCPLYTRKGTDF